MEKEYILSKDGVKGEEGNGGMELEKVADRISKCDIRFYKHYVNRNPRICNGNCRF